MNPTPDDFLKTRLSLIRRLRDWDDSASWEDFFLTYWSLIYGCAVKSGLSDATAQDIVQESIITVSKNIAQYDPNKCSFKGWLYMIVRSRIIDQLRKRHRRLKCIPLTENENLPDASHHQDAHLSGNALEDLWEKEWQNSLLQIAIEKVKKRAKPRQFQMYDLMVNKEWPATEVGKAMGVSESAVRKAKERIIAQIQHEVKNIGSDSPTDI
jgi:RNA polymerase sigma-70 factor (ECF subfamily)